MQWAGISQPGNDPFKKNKENQDVMAVIDSYGDRPDGMYLGVFDGHGSSGALASQYVCNALPDCILGLEPGNDLFVAVNNACLATNQEVWCSAARPVPPLPSTSPPPPPMSVLCGQGAAAAHPSLRQPPLAGARACSKTVLPCSCALRMTSCFALGRAVPRRAAPDSWP